MLELTVFCGGALVMVLEMVGSRVLAPHVGTSAVVWTGLIGVVLAALALGAWRGGRLADARPSRRGMALALAGAGLGSALAAYAHAGIGAWITAAVPNLYAAAVLASLCILAPAAFFFGMVTPYAIRLRIERVASAGAAAGRISALSTAGSIAGTFLGGFVLISFFGSTAILWGVAACMLALAACHAEGRLRHLLSAAALCALSLCLWQGKAADGDALPPLVESPYNCIRLYEGVDYAQGGRPVRLMATDPGYSQSGMLLDAPAEPYFRYTQFYALGPLFAPQARRVLMLGGGGYSVPKWLLSGRSPLPLAAEARLTVVEIDPVMTATARRWFGLADDPRLTILHEDARAFLNRQRDRFDLVLVDVFNAHYAVPFQMGTLEAAAALRRAVAPGGLVLMNIISAVEGPDGRLFQSICQGLRRVFPDVRVWLAGGRPAAEMQNVMVAAFAEARPAESPAPRPLGGLSSEAVASLLAAQLRRPAPLDTPPLTDDFAPVERYALMLLRP